MNNKSQKTPENELRHQEIRIIREVNIEAENLYPDAVALGDHAAYALKSDKKAQTGDAKKSHRSQMTSLENIAESAFKTSDIFDYIKRQTARFDYWRKDFSPNSNIAFGERLRIALEQTVAGKRDTICGRLKINDKTHEEKELRRTIYLQLLRQFIRQMVVQYEFRANLDEESLSGRRRG